MGNREYINEKSNLYRKLLTENEIPKMFIEVNGEEYYYTGIVVEKHYLVTHTYAEYHKVIK